MIHPHPLRRMGHTVRPAGQQGTGTVRTDIRQRIGPAQGRRIGAMPAGAEAKQDKQEGTEEDNVFHTASVNCHKDKSWIPRVQAAQCPLSRLHPKIAPDSPLLPTKSLHIDKVGRRCGEKGTLSPPWRHIDNPNPARPAPRPRSPRDSGHTPAGGRGRPGCPACRPAGRGRHTGG